MLEAQIQEESPPVADPDLADDPDIGEFTAHPHYTSFQATRSKLPSHPRRPPVPEDAKLPKFVYQQLRLNNDTSKWFKLSEASRKTIVSAVNSLGAPETIHNQQAMAADVH